MLVATAEQNQWKITVEADSEVWADWNGNGEKDDNELLTSGQLAEQTTASATLKIYGAVKKLSAPSNNIQSIDLEQATSLIEIDLSHNDLEDIDASECESLSVANVSHNQFEWIDFSYNDELTSLDCSHNENLSGLDLPDGLKELRCSNGALSSLSISSLSAYPPRLLGKPIADDGLLPKRCSSVPLSTRPRPDTLLCWRFANL